MGYRPQCFFYYGYDISFDELYEVYPYLEDLSSQPEFYDEVYKIFSDSGLSWDQYLIDPDWDPDYISFGEPLLDYNKDGLIDILQNEQLKQYYYDIYVKIMKKAPSYPIDIGYVCYMG